MINYHSRVYDAAVPAGIPNAVGDRLYAQDLFRDHYSNVDFAGRFGEKLFGDNDVILYGGVVSKGSGNTVNITACAAVVGFDVQVPNSFASIPPTTKAETIKILVEMTAQTNFAGSPTLDNVSTNYIKLAYNEADGSSRSRAKKAGSYVYEKTPSYTLTINTTVPAADEIELARFISVAGAVPTTFDYSGRTLQSPLSVMSYDCVNEKTQINGALKLYSNNTNVGAATGLTIEQDDTGDAVLSFLLTGGQQWQIGIDNSDSDKFIIGRGNDWGTGKDFVINTSGHVGLGQTDIESWASSLYALEGQTSSFVLSNSSRAVYLLSNVYNDGAWKYKTTESAGVLSLQGDSFRVRTASSGTIDTVAALEEVFRIDAGKLSTGGESSPDIDAGGLCLYTASTEWNVLSLKNEDCAHGVTTRLETDTFFKISIFNANARTIIDCISEEELSFSVRAVGTGENTATNTSTAGAIGLYASKANGTGVQDIGNTGNLLTITNNSTTRYIFKGDGTAYADVAWSTFSDQRLKENIKEIPYGLKELELLRPVIFNRKHVKEKEMIGFIAQEVKRVIPEVVVGEESEDCYLAVNYDSMIALLVKAIQEINDKLNKESV